MMATGSLYQPPGVGEMQSALEDEDRLEKLLASLEGRSRSAAPLQSGRFAVLNLEPLSDALRESRLRSKLEVAKKKKADIQGQYMEEVARRLRQFREKEEGQTQVTPLLDDQGEAVTNKLPGNPLAYDEYMSDPYPEVRKLTESREKGMDKLREALAKRAKMTSVQQNPRNPLAWEEQPELEITSDGIFDKRTGNLLRGTKQVPLPGGKPGQVANQNPAGALKAVGSSDTTINNNLPGDRKGGGLLLDTLPKEKEKADQAYSNYNAAQAGLQALADGAKTGYGADFFQNAKTLVHHLTGIELPVLGSMTSYGQLAAALAQSTIDQLGGLGAQVSNTDLAFARAAIGGTANDPRALERLLAIRAGTLRRYLEEYPMRVEEASVGAESEQVQRQLQRRFAKELPAMGLNFSHPEAEASFLANWKNIPYPTALQQVRGMGGAPQGPDSPTPPQAPATDWTKDPAERKRRVEEALRKYGGGR